MGGLATQMFQQKEYTKTLERLRALVNLLEVAQKDLRQLQEVLKSEIKVLQLPGETTCQEAIRVLRDQKDKLDNVPLPPEGFY